VRLVKLSIKQEIKLLAGLVLAQESIKRRFNPGAYLGINRCCQGNLQEIPQDKRGESQQKCLPPGSGDTYFKPKRAAE